MFILITHGALSIIDNITADYKEAANAKWAQESEKLTIVFVNTLLWGYGDRLLSIDKSKFDI